MATGNQSRRKKAGATAAVVPKRSQKVDLATRVRNAATGAAVPVVAGLDVVHDSRLKRIVAVTDEHVYLVDAATQESVQVRHGEYDLPQPKSIDGRLLFETTDKERERAQNIQQTLGPLVALGRNLSTFELDQARRSLGLGERTTRGYLRRLRVHNYWTSCLRHKSGPKKETQYVGGARRIVLESIVTELLKQPEGITEQVVINKVGDALHAAGLRPLSHVTIRKYLRSKGIGDLRLRRRLSGKVEQEMLTPVGDGDTAEYPLHKVQIDSTRADVIVVDESGKPIKRPWVTFVMDVFSRVVLGIHISLDSPSAIAVGSAIVDALMPKHHRLKSLGLTTLEWPCYGKFESISGLDHGREHANHAIAHGIRMLGLPEPEWRSDVRHGAIIERLIGTFVGRMHMLPGTTWSSAKAKGNYDSEHTAVLQVEEFEKWMVTQIVEYLATPHSGLNGITPLQAWQRGWKLRKQVPCLIQNERETRVSFLPSQERTAGKEGIEINGEHYRSPEIADLIRRHARVRVHYDPRDLSKVWVRSPNDGLVEVAWKHRNRRPYSLAYKRAKRMSDARQGRNPEMQEIARKARFAAGRIVIEATANTKRRRRESAVLEKRRGKQAEQDLGPLPLVTHESAKKIDWSAPPKRYPVWRR